MTRRKRVIDALNYIETDKVPKDLGGMRSTSISCFNYRELRKYLNLEDRLPIVYDEGQMLAIPEKDVLDALDCDVVFIENTGATNAYEIRGNYKRYNYNGRLEALVKQPNIYNINEKGTIEHNGMAMPKSAVVFNLPHAGQKFDINNLYLRPLDQLKKQLEKNLISDRDLENLAIRCQKARESTDRAIFLGGFEMFPDFVGGVANGSMVCLLEPIYMHDYSKLITEYAIKNFRKVIPMVKDNIDIILSGNNDMGTQNATIIAPQLNNEFFLEYFKQVNDVIHGLAPNLKTFLHSCGAIYEILDYIIEAKFDIVNPVQWTAGKYTYKQWKDKARNKITLWGGGVDAQHVLPFKQPKEIKEQVKEIVSYLKKDGGFIFCNIHNITAEIKPENIIAMYEAANEII